MIENIVYHIIIAGFIVIFIIYTLYVKQSYLRYKECFTPFLLKQNFILPADRNIFLKGLRALEKELSKVLETKISIQVEKGKQDFKTEDFKILFKLLNQPHILQKEIPDLNLDKSRQIVFYLNTRNSDQLKHTIYFSNWEIHLL